MSSLFSWVNSQERNDWVIREVCLLLLLLPNYFLKCWYHITSPSAVYESSNCSTFWPMPGRISLFNCRHSIGCLLVSHCGFNFLQTTYKWVFLFFLIHSDNLCLSVGTCIRPFIFKTITDIAGLTSTLFVTVLYSSHLFFFSPLFLPSLV